MPADRRRAMKRLAAYGLGVFGLPALWRKSLAEDEKPEGAEGGARRRAEAREDNRIFAVGKVRFATSPRQRMQEENPEYLFLGDSMANAFIDPAIVSADTGRRASVLYLPASTSARWYLMLKNYVLGAGVRPRVIFCVFRDCLWNMPGFRVRDAFWDEIERCMPEDSDPVIDRVLGGPQRGSAGLLERKLKEHVYPLQTARRVVNGGIESAGAAVVRVPADEMRQQATAHFSYQNCRHGVNAGEAFDGIDDIVRFTADPSQSFLPHAVELARSHGVKLHFIRVKRRAKKARLNGEPPELTEYVASMRAWLEAQGMGFFDMTPDPAITPGMYGEGDHLAVEHREWYTRRLLEQLKEAFT